MSILQRWIDKVCKDFSPGQTPFEISLADIHLFFERIEYFPQTPKLICPGGLKAEYSLSLLLVLDMQKRKEIIVILITILTVHEYQQSVVADHTNGETIFISTSAESYF